MVLVLLPVTDEEPVLPPAALAALARLGVTSVSLLRDEESAGIVLEGWALDPPRAEEAARLFTGGRARGLPSRPSSRREPGSLQHAPRERARPRRNDDDKHVFDIMIPLVVASLDGGCVHP